MKRRRGGAPVKRKITSIISRRSSFFQSAVTIDPPVNIVDPTGKIMMVYDDNADADGHGITETCAWVGSLFLFPELHTDAAGRISHLRTLGPGGGGQNSTPASKKWYLQSPNPTSEKNQPNQIACRPRF